MKIRIAFIASLITTVFCSLARPAQASWQNIPGCANDIGVGSNSSAWVIGCSAVAGGDGYEIFSLSGSTWNKVNGAASRIAVQPDGTPWVIDSSGKIYRWY